MHLGQLILILIATAIACDAFDRWFKRTALRIPSDAAALWPDRWISWGVFTDVVLDPQVGPMELRFFRLRLPIRTYGLVPNGGYSSFNYALRGHHLMWIDGSHLMPTNPMLGWSITPGLE